MQFNETPGLIFDFYHSLFLAYNRDADNILGKYGMDWNKESRKAYESLVKIAADAPKDFDLFFRRDAGAFAMFYDPARFWVCGSPENYAASLADTSEDELRSGLLKWLSGDAGRDDAGGKSPDLPAGEGELITMLDRSDKPPDIKWHALRFYRQPGAAFRKVLAFVGRIADAYARMLQKNAVLLGKFNQFLEEGLKREGRAFLERELQGLLPLDKYDRIRVSSAFLCDYAIAAEEDPADPCTVYLFLGRNYKKILTHLSGGNEEEHALTVLKVISDPTRFRIVKLLRRNRLYGQEIAEKVNLTMATVSHHMELLYVAARIVRAETVGNRVYYSLDEEALAKSLDALRRRLDLR